MFFTHISDAKEHKTEVKRMSPYNSVPRSKNVFVVVVKVECLLPICTDAKAHKTRIKRMSPYNSVPVSKNVFVYLNAYLRNLGTS